MMWRIILKYWFTILWSVAWIAWMYATTPQWPLWGVALLYAATLVAGYWFGGTRIGKAVARGMGYVFGACVVLVLIVPMVIIESIRYWQARRKRVA